MVSKIVMSRKRARTADYIGRFTNRGYKGRVVKEGTRSSRTKTGNYPALEPPPKPAYGKRPRLDRYSPDRDVILAPPSPSSSCCNGPVDNTIQEETYDPHGGDHIPQNETPNPLLEAPEGQSRSGTRSQDYLDEWQRTRVGSYLNRVILAESHGGDACTLCTTGNVDWKCLECIGQPRICTSCCRASHRANPLHRIERWTGTHWRPAWLWQVGLVVCLGHGGRPCPKYEASLERLEERLVSVNEVIDLQEDNNFGAKPEVVAIGCGELVVYVHTNGFHYLPTYPCWCSDGLDDDVQYLDRQLYPASWKNVSTVFTFQVLNVFHLLKVHAHMSTDQYASILERVTNFVFPAKSPDRRRELARVWLQWNYLTNLKRHGFGHTQPGDRPGKAELGLFCPACPTPGVNLPDDWRDDKNTWLYRRYLVADGNFVLDHLANRRGRDGIRLVNGAAYMTEPTRYAKHVKASRETQEPPTCNKLRAVSEKNVFKKGYDATGVVAVACARHGCFAPGSVVDMQKGERQLNVDYAFCQAMKNTKAFKTPGVILAYDVNCQYSVNFRKRVEKARYLKCDADFPIDFVIGLFHVHGHKDDCLSRFAPTFFPGAGVTSGEILESLWSTMNGAAAITRNMLLSNRSELLDACMADSNWRKLQMLGPYLVKQLELARSEVKEAADDFRGINENTSIRLRKRWKAQMNEANEARRSDPHAMDVYNVVVPKVATKDIVQAELMEEERNGVDKRGVVEWLADAIRIQESQINLRSLIDASKDPSTTMTIDLGKKSTNLVKDIAALYRQASTLFPGIDLEREVGSQWEHNGVEICVCEDECSCAELAELPWGRQISDTSGYPELAPIPLPSSFNDLPDGWNAYAKREERLRIAQAEEALEALRGEIAHKSFLYRDNRNWATGKRGRTRSYDEINEIERKMRGHIKRYKAALWALHRLGKARKITRFQEITRADTKAVTAIFDPNKRGERNEGLSWIWHVVVEGKKDKKGYARELYRVNWIRARSRRDRWAEEVRYVKAEMQWYIRYMDHFEKRARKWAKLDLGDGYSSYANKQADMWRRLGLEGRKLFSGHTPLPDLLRGEDNPADNDPIE